MADDNKNPAGDTERTSILPQSEAQATEQTEVLPAHVAQTETAQMPPVTQEERLLVRPWSRSRELLSVTRSAARPWRLATRQPSLHRRRPRGASARPSPVPQLRCCPSASARASSRMRPSWVMARTSMSRATRTVSATRATATRTRISAPAMASKVRVTASSRAPAASRVRVMASSRGLAVSRAIPAAPARDLPRREAEAPAASLEVRAVRTPPPRAKERPPAER